MQLKTHLRQNTTHRTPDIAQQMDPISVIPLALNSIRTTKWCRPIWTTLSTPFRS